MSDDTRTQDLETWPYEFGYTTLPALPDNAPRRNGKISKRLGRSMLALMGWRVVGRYPDVPKLIIAGGPHTSYWDGIVAFSVLLALDIDIRVMAKKTLFVGPTGWILNRLHAIPVNQYASQGTVDQMVKEFERCDQLVIGVSPEGARKKVKTWKTGFYRIAEKAGVPILTVALDFGNRCIVAGPTIVPSGDIKGDFEHMRAFMARAKPVHPESF